MDVPAGVTQEDAIVFLIASFLSFFIAHPGAITPIGGGNSGNGWRVDTGS